jgi:hypothetical protein
MNSNLPRAAFWRLFGLFLLSCFSSPSPVRLEPPQEKHQQQRKQGKLKINDPSAT